MSKLISKEDKSLSSLPSLTPDKKPFDYNTEMSVFMINDVKVEMPPADVISLIDNLKLLKGTRYVETGDSPKNTYSAWCAHLVKSNYKKIYECDRFCIYAALSDILENLIMFEIVHKAGGAKHVNVAVELSKYRL